MHALAGICFRALALSCLVFLYVLHTFLLPLDKWPHSYRNYRQTFVRHNIEHSSDKEGLQICKKIYILGIL